MDAKEWELIHGDCVIEMANMPDSCMDMAVFSPPFPALYAYTSEPGDIGNSEDLKSETKIHLSFFYRQFARILKPGRVVMVHVMQIPRMKRSGGVGLFDFRGFNIRLGERAGLVYEYDWLVRKNPQAQAIRTKSRELQFSGLESDRAKSRGTLGDYLIKFRAPGENQVPITDTEIEADDSGDHDNLAFFSRCERQVSRNDWIDWAECCWTGIKETDTLNVKPAKGVKDVKHVCPLQLGVIDRIVRLYSNPGETVFSPFSGVGSEGYIALKRGRKFVGIELKDEYYREACKNLERAITKRNEESRTLFDGMPA